MTRLKPVVLRLGAGLAVSLVVVAVATRVDRPEARSQSTGIREAANDYQGAVVSAQGIPAIADVSCSYDAVPKLGADVDRRVVDQAAQNPYSQATEGRIDRDQAISMARGFSSDPQAALGAKAAAAQVSAGWLGDTNPLINPSRCFWIVTVDGPYQPRSAPRGVESKNYGTYTVALDAASGEFLSISAGPESLNVLTGYVPGSSK